jgi:hypothetical protein
MSSEDEAYVAFAADISFLEFRHEEFGPSVIDVGKYSNEILELQSKKEWDINSLCDYLTRNPRSFIVFEALFREQRFSNAQLAHFFFDVDRLNSASPDSVYEYAVLNLRNDRNLFELCEKRLPILGSSSSMEQLLKNQSDEIKRLVVASFKMAISEYVSVIPEEPETLKRRICVPEFSDSSIRLSNYLLTRLKLNQFLQSVDVREYLKFKRRTKDIKGLHGKFGRDKVIRVLEQNGFKCIDRLLKDAGVTVLENDLRNQLVKDLPPGRLYCTEKQVEGVAKLKEGKLKKFDVIILSDSHPRHLFEVNFYTTSGTKIGINENEYVDLFETISKSGEYEFHWITDGTYWLSSDGKERYQRLLKRFGNVYNINIFGRNLDKFR